jgi:hypothetical protein
VSERLDRALEQRLTALAATGKPDWDDVTRRLATPARTLTRGRLVAAVAAAVALLLLAAVAAGLGSRVADWLSLSESGEQIPARTKVAHVTGDRLHLPGRRPIRLAEPLFAPFLGMDATLAVRSPDGGRVVYHATPGGTPELRIVDTRTGEDNLLVRSAQSVAWAERIAFVRGGRVMVANRPGGVAESWTPVPEQSRVVAAWARDVLLVEGDGVRAFTRPGHSRLLSVGSVAAVSPDGRAVLGTHLPVRGQDSPSATVHIDDVRTGETIAMLDLIHAGGASVPAAWVRGGIQRAAWRGDTVVGVSSAGAVSVLVVLRFDGAALHLERVLRLDEAARARDRGTLFFGNPVFTGQGTRHVLVQLRGPLGRGRYMVASVSCDLAKASCVQGRPARHRAWSAVVDNPSRPLR